MRKFEYPEINVEKFELIDVIATSPEEEEEEILCPSGTNPYSL